MDCMRKYLPEGVEFTPTEGGMFLWAKLPNGMSAVDLYRVALAKGVAICPGDPFYEKERNVSTFRINYSNSSDEVIEKGIRILGRSLRGADREEGQLIPNKEDQTAGTVTPRCG